MSSTTKIYRNKISDVYFSCLTIDGSTEVVSVNNVAIIVTNAAAGWAATTFTSSATVAKRAAAAAVTAVSAVIVGIAGVVARIRISTWVAIWIVASTA